MKSQFQHLNVSLYIARRIIGNKKPSFSGFIIKLATVAMAISVATMIITLSMVNGFQYEVAQKVFSFWGHSRVQSLEPMRSMVSEETTIKKSDSLEQIINAQSEIAHFHAFAARSIVLRSAGHFEGLQLKGVDSRFTQSPFARFIKTGSNIKFNAEGYSNNLIISELVANQLQVATGDTVSVFYLRNGEEIRTRSLIITGIYRTGIQEYDQNFAIADLAFLQRLNLWEPNQIAGYEIWLKDEKKASAISKKLSSQLPQGVVTMSVETIYPNIFDWLNIQNQTKQIVISVMLAVAIINLITCLLILVMERTKMVAVLAAGGMSGVHLRRIFWYYASWIAGIGIFAGLMLSLVLLGIQQYTGIIKMDEATYYVDRMPVKIVWWQVFAVMAAAFVVCVSALGLPLMYVQRISITKALRFS